MSLMLKYPLFILSGWDYVSATHTILFAVFILYARAVVYFTTFLIVLYYVDPNESDFARAGLVYTVSGETNLIGFHTQGNYHTAVSESFAIMGLTLFAEYIDAVAVGTINTTQTLGTLTVNSAAGSKSGDTKVTVTPAKVSAGNVYKYKVASSETSVDYGQNVKNWSAWDGESDITATTGQVITVVECDSTYKALSAGHATVTAKS
jgi:hypothetical protein